MRILILSFYFRPDLSAGSFRTTALVDALCPQLPDGSQVDVVTTLPNRYSTFSVEAPETENRPGLAVYRIALPPHRSGMLDQSRAYLVFAREVLRHVASRDYDIVYATSSRLMTAVLGAWIARRKRARFYLDLRDIFVDTIRDVLPGYLAIPAKPVFSALERWAVGSADKVNLASPGFSGYFTARYPGRRFSYFTNGIDDEFLEAGVSRSTSESAPGKDGEIRVLYAGNIGEGQGLHAIIPELAKRMSGRMRFKIIGDGGRKERLEDALVAAGVDNVELSPPVDRRQLIGEYRVADVLFIHLNNYEAFKKVLPSKLFEYGAMGKPVWAGLSGCAAEFVRAEIENSAVFPPCDAEQAEREFNKLKLHVLQRDEFISKYARANIARSMAADVIGVLNAPK